MGTLTSPVRGVVDLHSSSPIEISTVSPTTATGTWRRCSFEVTQYVVPAKHTLPLESTLRVTDAWQCSSAGSS
jgi:hypothetical protein